MATAREEAELILQLAGGDTLRAYEMVERQLAVLVLRTQVMLSLSGIVITVTGFSGRAIAQTSVLARSCIAIGIFVVLAAAATAIGGVLRLSWLTTQIQERPIDTVISGLVIRHRKTRFLQ